ncbi:MAG TPA: hypothetical protein VN706_11050 [Gemmatimonadaceae bacterium]|nr:hypothetical protein [Gemmatimonadaceae bacterium]
MKIRFIRVTGLLTAHLVFVAPANGVAQVTHAFARPSNLGASQQVQPRAHADNHFAEALVVLSPPADSAAHTHRQAAMAGGAIGAIVGGLSAAAYVLNATAYKCTTIGPACPDDPHTVRRVVVITTGVVVGGPVGAWIGRRIGGWLTSLRSRPAL